MTHHNVELAFRFLQLDKMQAITLSREIMGASYQPSDDAQVYVGSVPLLSEKMDDINHFFIRQKMSEKQCDILISAHAATAHGLLQVPHIVNRMLKDIDCPLTFSLRVVE